MLQMLLSEWLVRIFLLYLFVVGGVALIRRQQLAVSRPFVFSPISDIRDCWAASRASWLDEHPIRDNTGIKTSEDTIAEPRTQHFSPSRARSAAE